jgi:lysozyme family protein
LRNITDAEVNRIYFEWYWLTSGADKLPWPLCLCHFDTSVNAGPGRAAEMLAKSNGDFVAYVGHVGIWYTTLDDFAHFGRAWARRRFELLLEARK